MPKPNNDLMGEKLGQIALKLANIANSNVTNDETTLEIFKHLTTYYIGTTKINKKPDQPEEGEENFNDWRNKTASGRRTDTGSA